MVEAKHWTKLDDDRVQCLICPQLCKIADGETGICRGRINFGGVLYAQNFGECVSIAMDPIEKKPLYHFCPGKDVLSIACCGCNLRCDFCQNWTISQQAARTTEVPPETLIALARERNSFGVAYTYTEPIIWYEYLLAAGAALHEAGLKNILVTNGVINEEPLGELLPVVDAMNIDFKSMSQDFYRTYCHVDGLEAVLRTVRMAAGRCHIEVTNLMIEGLNTSEHETRELVDFLAGIDRRIPLHFSRYFPANKMDIPATPLETLERAHEIAREKLYYVYLGNVGLAASETMCPQCGSLLVGRAGYVGEVSGIEDGKCRECGRPADFVWCD